MLVVEDEHLIQADLARVFECCWDARLWPRITPHVTRAEVEPQDERHHRLHMTVVSDGRAHDVESLRTATPHAWIGYTQVRPPAFLRSHEGEWRFATDAGGAGVRVSLVHRANVAYDVAYAVLQVTSAAEADARIAAALKANGARTLLAIKAYLEPLASSPSPAAGEAR